MPAVPSCSVLPSSTIAATCKSCAATFEVALTSDTCTARRADGSTAAILKWPSRRRVAGSASL